MNYIESKDNKKLKLINKLSKRKYREEMGLTIVEGLRSVRQIIDDGIEFSDILICESKKDEILESISDFSKKNPKKNTDISKNINVVKDNVFALISDTVNSQGILAIVKIKEYSIDNIISKSKKILILDRVQDPGNVGTIFRTAIATNFDAIFYTKGTVDIFSPKVNRSAMGVNLAMPVFEIDDKDFKNLKKHFKIYATMLDKNAKIYTEIDYNEKFALVLGNEANGIDESISNMADEKIYIPISEKIESLNVSIAGAVIMFKSVEKLI